MVTTRIALANNDHSAHIPYADTRQPLRCEDRRPVTLCRSISDGVLQHSAAASLKNQKNKWPATRVSRGPLALAAQTTVGEDY